MIPETSVSRVAVLQHLKTYNLYYEGQNLQLRHREVGLPSFSAECPNIFSTPSAFFSQPNTPYPSLAVSQRANVYMRLPTGRRGAHLRGLAEHLLGPSATHQASDAGWPRARPAASLLHVLALRLQSGQSKVSGPDRSCYVPLTMLRRYSVMGQRRRIPLTYKWFQFWMYGDTTSYCRLKTIQENLNDSPIWLNLTPLALFWILTQAPFDEIVSVGLKPHFQLCNPIRIKLF